MHRRHQHINIPTEIVRTIVSIAEAGSFSKAGEKMGLSQPAVSAQVKRLQLMVGGPLFEKGPGGVSFTARGRQILDHARKLIDANDQILSIGGGSGRDRQPLRLGLAALYATQFLKRWCADQFDGSIHFLCDHSAELGKSLVDGYLDIACLLAPPDGAGEFIHRWTEDFVWVRSRDFVLSPGAPVPLIGWPGGAVDRTPVNALEKAGIAYREVFASADLQVRLAAVEARTGLMTMPPRLVPPSLVVAKDYYLPPLESLPAGVVVRHTRDRGRIKGLLDALRAVAPAPVRSLPDALAATPA